MLLMVLLQKPHFSLPPGLQAVVYRMVSEKQPNEVPLLVRL